VKAKPVKGLDCSAPLDENARRIVEARLGELIALGRQSLDPSDEQALHDARIAAKRLRYVLEMMTPVFGDAAARAAKEARNLQDLLGEIHDCDELMPVLRRHVRRMREEDAIAVRARAEPHAGDLEPSATLAAPHRSHYRGIEVLHSYTRARRDVLYERFLREWRRLEQEGFRSSVEQAVAPAPAPAPASAVVHELGARLPEGHEY
jgi:hypothetical protein